MIEINRDLTPGNQRLIDIICERKDIDAAKWVFGKSNYPLQLNTEHLNWLRETCSARLLF